MAIIEDVEVQIVSTSTGEALLEYDNPDRDATVEPVRVEKYIEAATDEEFHIVVTLREGFDYHGANGILVTYDLDGNMLKRQEFFRRPDDNHRLTTAKIIKFKSAQVKVDNTWKRIHLSFGSVDVDEDHHTEKSTLKAQSKALGNIELRIERVMRRERAIARPHHGTLGKRPEKLDKKLLIKSISHTLKPSRASPIAPPSASKFKSTPITGQHGKPLTVKFRYRSHLGLQTLGCIQRTPSPVPLSERAPADLTDKEELVRIRAELQDLRNENRTLVRANREMNKQIDEAKEMRERMVAFVGGSSSIQPEPVKRERVEEEEQDSGFPMGTSAGRQIKRAKTYDLTGDN